MLGFTLSEHVCVKSPGEGHNAMLDTGQFLNMFVSSPMGPEHYCRTLFENMWLRESKHPWKAISHGRLCPI